LLPHLAADQVTATANRIVSMLNDQPIGMARSSINVSARVGLASWSPGLKGLELLGRAAHALEEAQSERGALAAVYEEPPELADFAGIDISGKHTEA
jgi:PleD family two-component response regulator